MSKTKKINQQDCIYTKLVHSNLDDKRLSKPAKEFLKLAISISKAIEDFNPEILIVLRVIVASGDIRMSRETADYIKDTQDITYLQSEYNSVIPEEKSVLLNLVFNEVFLSRIKQEFKDIVSRLNLSDDIKNTINQYFSNIQKGEEPESKLTIVSNDNSHEYVIENGKESFRDSLPAIAGDFSIAEKCFYAAFHIQKIISEHIESGKNIDSLYFGEKTEVIEVVEEVRSQIPTLSLSSRSSNALDRALDETSEAEKKASDMERLNTMIGLSILNDEWMLEPWNFESIKNNNKLDASIIEVYCDKYFGGNIHRLVDTLNTSIKELYTPSLTSENNINRRESKLSDLSDKEKQQYQESFLLSYKEDRTIYIIAEKYALKNEADITSFLKVLFPKNIAKKYCEYAGYFQKEILNSASEYFVRFTLPQLDPKTQYSVNKHTPNMISLGQCMTVNRRIVSMVKDINTFLPVYDLLQEWLDKENIFLKKRQGIPINEKQLRNYNSNKGKIEQNVFAVSARDIPQHHRVQPYSYFLKYAPHELRGDQPIDITESSGSPFTININTVKEETTAQIPTPEAKKIEALEITPPNVPALKDRVSISSRDNSLDNETAEVSQLATKTTQLLTKRYSEVSGVATRWNLMTLKLVDPNLYNEIKRYIKNNSIEEFLSQFSQNNPDWVKYFEPSILKMQDPKVINFILLEATDTIDHIKAWEEIKKYITCYFKGKNNNTMRVSRTNEIDDLVSECIVKIINGIPNFKGGSMLSTWIHQVTMNASINIYKSDRNNPLRNYRDTFDIEGPDDGGDNYGQGHFPIDHANPAQELEQEQLSRGIDNALGDLPEDLQEALTLYEIELLPYKEIAEKMDCPIGTVRSRIFRAREAVEKQLQDLCLLG